VRRGGAAGWARSRGPSRGWVRRPYRKPACVWACGSTAPFDASMTERDPALLVVAGQAKGQVSNPLAREDTLRSVLGAVGEPESERTCGASAGGTVRSDTAVSPQAFAEV
jgi:hypothetical protein